MHVQSAAAVTFSSSSASYRDTGLCGEVHQMATQNSGKPNIPFFIFGVRLKGYLAVIPVFLSSCLKG
jgi:hypothetical protein